MSRNVKADCANSGRGVKTPAGVQVDESHDVECTRCHQQTRATANWDGYSTYFIHLRPGKTLADRL